MMTLVFIGLLAFLAPSPVWAGATITSTYDGNGTTTTTATIANVACTGSNTVLLVFPGSFADGVPTTVTKGAASLTLLDSHDRGGLAYSAIWYLKGASSTPETVTATWAAATSSGAGVSALCLENAVQGTTFGTPAKGQSGGTVVSGQSVTGSTADDLIIDTVSFSSGGGATITPDSPGTQQTTINPFGGWTQVSGSKASGTSQSPTWVITSAQDWSQIVVNVFGIASGGGGSVSRGLLLGVGP